MAELSLGECKWRMVRRALLKSKKRADRSFTLADVRNMTRHDKEHFGWLLRNGFVAAAPARPGREARYRLTDLGAGACDMGYYDDGALPAVRPAAASPSPPAGPARRGRPAGRHA